MSNFVATIPRDEVAKCCGRWKIRELALFGSTLRDDIGPGRDVDILVTFAKDASNRPPPLRACWGGLGR